MRRLCLILLLIALLPLRGWVSDAMALNLLPPLEAVQTQGTATHDHCDMAGARLAQTPSDPGSEHPDGSVCTACQVCHAVALTVSLPVLQAAPLPGAPPVARLPADTSAQSAPEHKPPILLMA